MFKENEYTEAMKQYADDATISDPKTGACWEGYERVPNTKKGSPEVVEKKVLKDLPKTGTKSGQSTLKPLNIKEEKLH